MRVLVLCLEEMFQIREVNALTALLNKLEQRSFDVEVILDKAHAQMHEVRWHVNNGVKAIPPVQLPNKGFSAPAQLLHVPLFSCFVSLVTNALNLVEHLPPLSKK